MLSLWATPPLTLLAVTMPEYENNTGKGTLPLASALKHLPRRQHEAMARFLESNRLAAEVIPPPITHGLPKVNPIISVTCLFLIGCAANKTHGNRPPLTRIAVIGGRCKTSFGSNTPVGLCSIYAGTRYTALFTHHLGNCLMLSV
ncbi:hypothetical protein BDY19DRAFT_750154 [Irpex rosettiformis]|uniref:Uncharacterized protein n=1 Tax=Irpex rosettiformis TaxID=378272 RepID=A0ACB8U706_9APHY|nr:hypothetical protein BDY19DRAFT_750154 [Irpex rosettiformis]